MQENGTEQIESKEYCREETTRIERRKMVKSKRAKKWSKERYREETRKIEKKKGREMRRRDKMMSEEKRRNSEREIATVKNNVKK